MSQLATDSLLVERGFTDLVHRKMMALLRACKRLGLPGEFSTHKQIPLAFEPEDDRATEYALAHGLQKIAESIHNSRQPTVDSLLQAQRKRGRETVRRWQTRPEAACVNFDPAVGPTERIITATNGRGASPLDHILGRDGDDRRSLSFELKPR